MQCKTERCLIRELVPDDWKSMQKIAVGFRKSKYAVYDMPLPEEDAEIIARTKQFAQTQMFYAVLLHDVMIGYICFHEDHGMYDLGYCFHSDYQGKGYAFESCCAMMNYIFHERSINIFTAGTALENKPSCKLLEKLGFTLQNENYDWDTLAKNSNFFVVSLSVAEHFEMCPTNKKAANLFRVFCFICRCRRRNSWFLLWFRVKNGCLYIGNISDLPQITAA